MKLISTAFPLRWCGSKNGGLSPDRPAARAVGRQAAAKCWINQKKELPALFHQGFQGHFNLKTFVDERKQLLF